MKFALILSVVVVVLIGTLFWGINEHSSAYTDDRCLANFSYADSTDLDSFKFSGNIAFEFLKNKSGQFNIYGNMSYQGENYTFARYVKFNYINIKDNKYKIKIVSQNTMAHDNVPETLSPFAVKIFLLSGEHTIYLHKNDNGFITIGNALSPLMNCVIQS